MRVVRVRSEGLVDYPMGKGFARVYIAVNIPRPRIIVGVPWLVSPKDPYSTAALNQYLGPVTRFIRFKGKLPIEGEIQLVHDGWAYKPIEEGPTHPRWVLETFQLDHHVAFDVSQPLDPGGLCTIQAAILSRGPSRISRKASAEKITWIRMLHFASI